MSTAEAIATNFWARTRNVDRSDLIQEAHLAQAMAKRTFTPERGSRAAYENVAIRRALWGYVLRNGSPVAARRAADLKGVQARSYEDVQEADDTVWREQVRSTLASELAGEPLAAEVMLIGYKPAEVAERHAVPVQDVYKALARSRYRLKQSRRVLALWAQK